MSRMTAREMFEENGWEAQEGRLAYWKEDSHKSRWCISFLQSVGEVHFYVVNDDEELWSVQYVGSLTPSDICAIVQQCYELGWFGYTGRENEQNDKGIQEKEKE